MQISNSVVGEVCKCRIYTTVNHPWYEHAFPLTGFAVAGSALIIYMYMCFYNLCREFRLLNNEEL